MTQQRAHVFRIDDREWAIVEWDGSRDVVPESEALGFTTTMESTANYAGRIDTFVVEQGRLRLAVIDAHLDDPHVDFVPENGRREDVTERSWALVFQKGQQQRKLCTDRRVLLHFDDLWIAFTGRITLEGDDDRTLTLAFDAGTLVGRSSPRDVAPEE